ncbi:MAG: D-alanine--D-alanine ligase [Proteobacteria bacterium]|nr:D-alanine--D-alanine ligase [Pseudomonadota bacterium]
MHVAVIMGGTSAERAVSLRSGKAVLNALQAQDIKAVALDGVDALLQENLTDYDAVFNILHGEAGENGELAGLLSSLKVKYTGCDINGAVLSWNKAIAKTLVSEQGLHTPTAQILKHAQDLKVIGNGPWIVKPTKEGSSVGLYYAQDVDELKIAVKKSLQTVDSILVENFIQGSEYTVAIIKAQVLPVVRIQPNIGLYDYAAKYESKETQYFCPSGLSDEQEQALKTDALIAYQALELKGWARIDFIVDNSGNRWFLEANTTPGMTLTSLVPKAAAAMGWSFNYLVQQILTTAFEDDNYV